MSGSGHLRRAGASGAAGGGGGRNEAGDVGPLRQFDANSAGGALVFVIVLEAGAELAGLDADDGVDAGVEVAAPFEDGEAEGTFAEFGGAAGEGFGYGIAQEPGKAGGACEPVIGEYPFQFGKHSRCRRLHWSG